MVGSFFGSEKGKWACKFIQDVRVGRIAHTIGGYRQQSVISTLCFILIAVNTSQQKSTSKRVPPNLAMYIFSFLR